MTALSTNPLSASGPTHRRAWLARAARRSGRLGPLAAVIAFGDALAAVGFAGGLSLALTRLPQGVAAAAPGAAVALLAGLARGGLGFGAAAVGGRAAAVAKTGLRDRLVPAALAARPCDRLATGVSMALIVEGVEALDGYCARFSPARTAAVGAPFLIMAAMAGASPVAAAIALATLAPFALAMALVGGAAAEETRRQFQALGRLSGFFADRVRALPAILAFQAEAQTSQSIAAAAHDLSRRTLAVLKVAFLSSGALEFFAALSVALVAVYCGFSLLHLLPFPAPERLDLGRAFFVLALAPEVYVPWRRLAAAYHDRQAAEAAVDALAALEAAPRPKIKAQPAPTVEPPPGVTLERVCVTYPDNDRPSLKDFDLRIGPGEIVALMGPSGSGKTTILNLVLGLLEPDSGAVLIDGTSPGAGSRPMAWAGQWPVVAPGTLGENLAMAKPKATRQELLTILRLVGLDGAGGLDRPINERGGGLSGGERRRLGLGRAFLKASSILLLDEPTANLDPASEQIMIPIIAAAAAGRTTLIATHSPAVAALADRVIHLEA